jgi:hypothetical protein
VPQGIDGVELKVVRARACGLAGLLEGSSMGGLMVDL